jgi:hypothetical protein
VQANLQRLVQGDLWLNQVERLLTRLGN